MRIPYFILLCLVGGWLPGCTNYLYTGNMTAQDSLNQPREFVLYWSKTDPLFGSPKAGPASLRTQCSLREMSFVEKENGIVFLGDPGKDVDVIHNTPVSSQDHVCGLFAGEHTFADIQEGPLDVMVFCKPVVDEFSANPQHQTYLKARPEPYPFEITQTKQWSFLGELPKAPALPPCPATP